jgi:4-alpha-glucanotransferase
MTNPLLDHRRAGVLLHLTSLPGNGVQGNMGVDAYQFVDFLAAAGMTVWQVLPIGPAEPHSSPYQSDSVHAGNTLLIDMQQLITDGWLAHDPGNHGEPDLQRHQALLREAKAGFERQAQEQDHRSYLEFKETHASWLDDYALYKTIAHLQGGRPWWEWPISLRDRDPDALAQTRYRHYSDLEQIRFEQFVFYRQWQRLHTHARQRGVYLYGDVPYYAAHNSVDTWVYPYNFRINAVGQPQYVAGVPPDDFTATGQRWGNPVYNWDRIAADGFVWWLERIKTCLTLFDILRLDHFRGFESFWQIPVDCPTAERGEWIPAPGDKLLTALQEQFPQLPLVVEDLGIITREVRDLRDRFQLAGLKVLQFAFDNDSDNPYLLHNHVKNSVVCTGTHDNNTTLGWFNDLDEVKRQHVIDYLAHPGDPMPWPLIRAAFSSVAQLAIVPMQDLLCLDARHRMNTPGIVGGNWSWRFTWQDIPPDLAQHLKVILKTYDRLAP